MTEKKKEFKENKGKKEQEIISKEKVFYNLPDMLEERRIKLKEHRSKKEK